MPFDREQSEIGKRLPGSKRQLAALSAKSVVAQQPAHVGGFGPELVVLGENADAVGDLLRVGIRDAGDGGDAGDAAARRFALNHSLHRYGRAQR